MSMSGTASLASPSSSMVVEPWQPRHHRRNQIMMTIPELLRMRQTFGVASPQHNPLKRSVGKSSVTKLTNPYLASRMAWNARRMQNTILVVGPGTPASVVTTSSSSRKKTGRTAPARDRGTAVDGSQEESPAPSSSSEEEENAPMEDDEEDDEESSPDNRRRQRRRFFVRGAPANSSDSDDDASIEAAEEYECLAGADDDVDDEEDDDDDNDEDDSDDDDDSAEERVFRAALLGRRHGQDPPTNSQTQQPHYCPSMRHGGCINTAAWLDAGWRLSTVNTNDPTSSSAVSVHGIPSEECPTQLVTSGDDHLVKFWDVREAMGMSSPLPGGRATICPLSASESRNPHDLQEEWEELYDERQCNIKSRASGLDPSNNYHLPGSVRLISTLHTGHRGNVFHVTPLADRPGVVATCGADGFLRITDIETGDSKVVISPEYENEMSGMLPIGLMSLRSAMCYSHHFVNQNVGLLCSERGLKRFDLRLSPREQTTERLIGGSMFRTCKACAILAAPSSSSTAQVEGGDPAYVFVGGSSRLVALCDLRMSDESQNRAVQIYTPSSLTPSSHVSVSGIDLSKDRQELLVSYESDQIYTFPIFPKSQLQGCSVVSQIEEAQAAIEAPNGDEEGQRKVKPLHELATYGAHLNRFTFLKNARYAGPRDEYICTGSDSGHAWVYEKATGAVASFWMADNSTCNGVIPHPSLPVFVTYGIDSTAKLWRSTIPVDRDLDDSPVGRLRHFRESSYIMTPTTRNWDEVHAVLDNLDLRDGGTEETEIYPDNIPSTKVLMRRGRLSRSLARETADSNRGVPRIGNDLHNLHATLKENLYTCLRSIYEDDDVPVEGDVEDLKQRVSLIRLRFQADRLGLNWNLSVPWAMSCQGSVATNENKSRDKPDDYHVEPADLVPDFPSDWLPYDPEMCFQPFDFCNFFKAREYHSFYANRYPYLSESRGLSLDLFGKCVQENEAVTYMSGKEISSEGKPKTESDEQTLNNPNTIDRRKIIRAESILLETMNTLKDGGNRAMKVECYDVAAIRYDKAIQYGSMLYMKNFASTVEGTIPLLKTLVLSRLNMSLLMLNPHFSELQVAERQAKQALKDLDQYAELSDHGTVSSDAETKDEILRLRAKAFFRMGSAQVEMGDYTNAIKAFEESIVCTGKLAGADRKPDHLVVRRLTEAKREQVKRKKRLRNKLKDAIGSASPPMSASTPSLTPSQAAFDAPGTPVTVSRTSKTAVVTETRPRGTARTISNSEADEN